MYKIRLCGCHCIRFTELKKDERDKKEKELNNTIDGQDREQHKNNRT